MQTESEKWNIKTFAQLKPGEFYRTIGPEGFLGTEGTYQKINQDYAMNLPDDQLLLIDVTQKVYTVGGMGVIPEEMINLAARWSDLRKELAKDKYLKLTAEGLLNIRTGELIPATGKNMLRYASHIQESRTMQSAPKRRMMA